MGGCQNYGPFLGTPNKRCRIIIGTQKGTPILTTTHMVDTIFYSGLQCNREPPHLKVRRWTVARVCCFEEASGQNSVKGARK